MKHPDVPLEKISDLVDALRTWSTASKPTWFRGQCDKDWDLIPSLYRRPAGITAERAIIKVFKQQSRPYLTERPTSEWEWLFLMQHHRLPTRLLDWSQSPLVALYFALFDKDAKHESKDAALWVLDPIELNKSAGHRRLFELELLAFDVDAILDSYLPDQINPNAPANPVAAIGPRNSPRMVAQTGTFTITHADPIAIQGVGAGSHVWRLVIPSASKPGLREELGLLGITEDLLFPDLDRVADAAMRLVP